MKTTRSHYPSLSLSGARAPAALLALTLTACSADLTGSGGSGEGGGGEGGAGGVAGSGGAGGECVLPSRWLELSLIENGRCTGAVGSQSVVDGSFQPVAGGFRVINATTTVEILEVEPAIPAETFVRLTYGCNQGWYGFDSAYVRLENLPTLEGAANPTEDGSRLWYYVVAGGEYASGAPFKVDTAHECGLEEGSRWTGRRSLILTGETFSVTIPSGEAATFHELWGVHAGTYEAENVRIVLIHDPGHYTTETQYRITRAD